MKQLPTIPPDCVREVFIIRCHVCESFNSIFCLKVDDRPIEWHCEDCGNRLNALPGEDLFHFVSRVRRLPNSI